jgi:hypothetical protein
MDKLASLSTLPIGLKLALAALIVLQITLDVIALVDLYKRPKERLVFDNKWVWLAIILLVNTIGAVIYLAAARRGEGPVESAPKAPDSSEPARNRAESAADLLYGKRKEGSGK